MVEVELESKLLFSHPVILTLCSTMDCRMPGLSVHHHLPKFTQVHVPASVMPSSHLILWCPLLFLPSVFPSTRDLSNELAVRIRWPKNWSFSFSNSPSNEYSKLISLTIDWFDLLTVQGTLRSLLQHHILKISILWRSVFFTVQLSTIICDHREDHSLDYTDLSQQSDVCFSIYCLGLS